MQIVSRLFGLGFAILCGFFHNTFSILCLHIISCYWTNLNVLFTLMCFIGFYNFLCRFCRRCITLNFNMFESLQIVIDLHILDSLLKHMDFLIDIWVWRNRLFFSIDSFSMSHILSYQTFFIRLGNHFITYGYYL
jgi:hypothetical protein